MQHRGDNVSLVVIKDQHIYMNCIGNGVKYVLIQKAAEADWTKKVVTNYKWEMQLYKTREDIEESIRCMVSLANTGIFLRAGSNNIGVRRDGKSMGRKLMGLLDNAEPIEKMREKFFVEIDTGDDSREVVKEAVKKLKYTGERNKYSSKNNDMADTLNAARALLEETNMRMFTIKEKHQPRILEEPLPVCTGI